MAVKYVIVSGEPRSRGAMTTDLAFGPFTLKEDAEKFVNLLIRTTKGEHVILTLHPPVIP